MKSTPKLKFFFFYLTLSSSLVFFFQNSHAQQIVDAIHLDENAGGLQIGEKVPNLVLPNRYNSTSDLYSLGGKYIYLHYWASWCPCSQPHIPNYKVLYDKYQKANFVDATGFEIYSVSIDENPSAWNIAVEDYNMVWPHNARIQDVDGENQLLMWDVRTVPTAYIIDPRGVVIAKNPSLIEMDGILSERSDQPGPRKLGRQLLAQVPKQTRPTEWNTSTDSWSNNAQPSTTSYTTDTQIPSDFRTYNQMDYSNPNPTTANSFNTSNQASTSFNTYSSTSAPSSATVIESDSFQELKVNVGEFYMLTQDHVDAVKDLGKLEVKNMPSGSQSIIIKDLANHDTAYQTLLEVHKRGFTDAYLTF